MKTLQIDESKAKSLYKTADDQFKTILEDTFGKKFFEEKITDRVKSYEDACEVVGISPLTLANFNFLPKQDRLSQFAGHQLTVIARALNEGWQPDWADTDQYKWVVYQRYKAGFGLSYDGYDFWSAYAAVGSRLCYKSSELAEYAGTQFEEIYRNHFTL